MTTQISLKGRAVLAAAVSAMLCVPSTVLAGRYDGLVKGLDEFVGGAASIKRNDSDAFVAVGQNGNRFRMDLTGHGDKPHFHLEVPGAHGRHVDAPGVNHRNYFKE